MGSSIDARRVRPSLLAFTFVLAVLVSPTLNAQSTFAILTGTVTDPSGAVLPGVTVTATNTATQAVRTAVTDNVGEYQLLNLDAGTYRVTIGLTGFAQQARETQLLARQTVRVDVQLPIAGAREQLDVIATRPVIETDTATIDNSKSGDEINKLALNFRATTNTSPLVVATLAAGVQQDTGGNISLAGNLPYTTVMDLHLGPDGRLYAATHGRGIWSVPAP